MKIVFISLLISLQAYTASYCPHKSSLEEISQMVESIIEKDFPSLSELYHDQSISIKLFKSKTAYLKTDITPRSSFFFKKKDDLNYSIDINKKLFKCSPQPEALEAILVHELSHISDYIEMDNKKKIFSFVVKYLISKKYNTRYERSTDMVAIKRGYKEGLILYREWIYQQLTPKQLRTKKKRYYTPEEMKEMDD